MFLNILFVFCNIQITKRQYLYIYLAIHIYNFALATFLLSKNLFS